MGAKLSSVQINSKLSQVHVQFTHMGTHTCACAYTATQCLYMHVPGTHTLGSTPGWNWDLFPGGQSKNGQSGFCTK